MSTADARLVAPAWDATSTRRTRVRVRLLALTAGPLALVYLTWLLRPERIGHPALYAVLVAAELFNVAQAFGFWWTAWHDRPATDVPFAFSRPPTVDVFVPVYNEPLDVVEPTIKAATRLAGGDVRVALLDDKGRNDLKMLAARHRVAYLRRGVNTGAKAGNINHALGKTAAEFVVVLDCDHVPDARLLLATLGRFADPNVAMVQTPQYYANSRGGNLVAAASWAQQALFFGVIARGKASLGAMFCCGTNVVFRRSSLEAVGGFPEESITEDFELSLVLHENGWKTEYVPRVLARGLGPEDMASYVSQQHRWARGCLSALGTVLSSRLPLRLRAQYLLSASYFLTGWTALIYMAMPVIRITTGAQPIAATAADQFLLHFAPYFGMAILAVALAGSGSYTFGAFALTFSSFWIHVHASLKALFKRPGRFVVTPKKGASGLQLRPVRMPLAAIAVLVGAAGWGLARDTSPAMLNNVAFAMVHVVVLANGVRPALRPRAAARAVRIPEGRDIRAA
jgi:cellulose synthase (UDP-forming)